MEKCKKILSLFNKRFKSLYLNGFSEYQILKEIRIFYKLENEEILSFINNRKEILEKNNEILTKKIGTHFCNKIYINDKIDYNFTKINKICNNTNYKNLDEFQLIDELLDNPRIPYIEDITLSSAISIYDKPFNGKYISKDSYLELINGIYKDCINNQDSNNEDNLLLFENAFKHLDYSISSTKDRVEIYQELLILLAKLAKTYNFSDEITQRYFNNFSLQFIRDLIRIDDNKYIFNVFRNIYSNTCYNFFILIIPFFLENLPNLLINQLIKRYESDIFLKNNDNFNNILNLFVSNSGDKELLIESLNNNKNISSFERYFYLLEFSINFDDKNSVKYYLNKIRFEKDYEIYKSALVNINRIVNNFDKIIKVEKKILKINQNSYSNLLIEVEQLNYLDRLVYSCCINRSIYSFLNSKEFNFYFLLLLISLGLKEKATIYFYHNIKYIKFNNPKDLFIKANILFTINYFDFSIEILNRLKKFIENNKNKSLSSLYSYINIELDLINLLMIPLFNDEEMDEINNHNDNKEIV